MSTAVAIAGKEVARKRLQTAAIGLFLATPVSAVLLTAFLMWSPLSRRWLRVRIGRVALSIYMFYILCIDRLTAKRGGRPSPTLRQHSAWSHFRNYFPARLIREGEVDPRHKYVIGLHPHGIWSVAGFSNFVSDNNALPGVDYRVGTLAMNFYIPFWREFLLSMGLIDVSADSCKYLLDRGISVAIVVGGAAEALDARPGANDLTLGRRLGFVRIAMENGAKLLPVFSFGENDVYEQVVPNPPGSLVRKIQEKLMDWTTFSLPLIWGKWGAFPLRRAVTTIIGHPIDVPHIKNPTLEQVLTVHARYIEALHSMYEAYKDVVELSPIREPRTQLAVVDQLRNRDLLKMTNIGVPLSQSFQSTLQQQNQSQQQSQPPPASSGDMNVPAASAQVAAQVQANLEKVATAARLHQERKEEKEKRRQRTTTTSTNSGMNNNDDNEESKRREAIRRGLTSAMKDAFANELSQSVYYDHYDHYTNTSLQQPTSHFTSPIIDYVPSLTTSDGSSSPISPLTTLPTVTPSTQLVAASRL